MVYICILSSPVLFPHTAILLSLVYTPPMCNAPPLQYTPPHTPHSQGCSVSDGRVFVAPYDDPYVIAGQGTIGAEIIRQLGPRVDKLHAIFVAVGGGGLIAGIAAYIKMLCPDVKVCVVWWGGVAFCGGVCMY